jgi:uncharacterized membrane protein
MILTISEALAGHAGESGMSAMPHEVMGGITILAVVGLVLVVLGAVGVWLLFRIERRLRKLQ